MTKSKIRTAAEKKLEELGWLRPSNKVAIFENSLSRIQDDFSVRVTPDKIIIKDNETYLKFTPKKMGEVVVEKIGEKLTVYVEKEKRG